MKNLKFNFLLCFAVLITLFASCRKNEYKDKQQAEESYVKNAGDTTYEDGGGYNSDSPKNEIKDRKDSVTVGPVAPKSPPHGGRNE
mgnify:CR=1 FL=1